jgi:exopolysaccharide biosynthesis polyprenyl glycosylphosphotransferase
MSLGIQRNSKHLGWAGFLFGIDLLLVWASFLFGIYLRFGEFSPEKLLQYRLGVALASVVLPSVLYVGGLYSPTTLRNGGLANARWLLAGFSAALAAVLMVGSLDFGSRVGRGVLLVAMASLVASILVRHLVAARLRRRRYGTLVCVVADETDEHGAERLLDFWGGRADVFGLVAGAGYHPDSGLPCLGEVAELSRSASRNSIDVALVRDRHFSDPDIAAFLRRLRYEGTEILPLSDACEDAFHAVPLELVTDAWFFRASNQAQLFYSRKLKRLSDIALAALFLVLLSPFLGLGALVVRLSSPGPVIFRQARAGRFGRPFTMLKLRTMHVAERKEGAKWATQETARIFPLGRILRTFRIDEIPQLVNVLRGEMSFVGPRPEQIEIVEELERAIPFYRERLLVQPGITGWAQVCYPYGASVEDSVRKLEYDLYYLKHMGIFFDLFILLETVMVIVRGGVSGGGDTEFEEFRESLGSADRDEGPVIDEKRQATEGIRV